MKLHKLLLSLIAGSSLLLIQPVSASEVWPSKPVQLVVPIDPGTTQDAVSRRLATALSSIWGQTVTVINQPGAAGAIGTQTVANSAPDGYTMGVISATFTGSMAVRPNLPFAREKLIGVTKFGRQDFVIFASTNAPFSNVQQMVAFAKQNPGKLDYATPGIGSYVHITMEHLAQSQDLKLVHVPYKGIMQAVPDVLNNRINLIITTNNTALEGFVTKGEMKVIGSLGRNATYQGNAIQSLSTVASDVQANGYYGIVVAAGTPKHIVDKIHRDVTTVVSTPEFRQFMTASGAPPVSMAQGEFDRWIDQEVAKLKRIVSQANIKAE